MPVIADKKALLDAIDSLQIGSYIETLADLLEEDSELPKISDVLLRVQEKASTVPELLYLLYDFAVIKGVFKGLEMAGMKEVDLSRFLELPSEPSRTDTLLRLVIMRLLLKQLGE